MNLSIVVGRFSNLLGLVVILLFSGLITLTDITLQTIFIISILFHSSIFLFMKSGIKSLGFKVTGIFLFGCASVIYYMYHPSAFRLIDLGGFVFYSLSLFVIWYLHYAQIIVKERRKKTSQQVKYHKRYCNIESIYTLKELENRCQSLSKIEESYFLIISARIKSSFIQSAVHRTIGHTIYNVMKHEEAFIGEKDDLAFVVFLPNTTRQQINVFTKKLYRKLGKVLHINEINLTIEIVHSTQYKYQLSEVADS